MSNKSLIRDLKAGKNCCYEAAVVIEDQDKEILNLKDQITKRISEIQAQSNLLRICFGLNPDGTRYIAEKELAEHIENTAGRT